MAKTDLTIQDRDGLEGWLTEQPREIGLAVAARATLRVLPLALLASETDNTTDVRSQAASILWAFRALAVTWAAARYPERGPQLAAAAESSSYAAYAKAGKSAVVLAAAYAAAAAARDGPAAAEAAATAAATATEAAANFVRASPENSPPEQVWRAMLSDVDASHRGETAAVLAAPLWRNIIPGWMPDWAAAYWNALRESMPPGEGWQVWVSWYEARRRGGPTWRDLSAAQNEDLECAIATLPDYLWNEGPAVVNDAIERLIVERYAPQEGAGFTAAQEGASEISTKGLERSVEVPKSPALVEPNAPSTDQAAPHYAETEGATTKHRVENDAPPAAKVELSAGGQLKTRRRAQHNLWLCQYVPGERDESWKAGATAGASLRWFTRIHGTPVPFARATR